MTTTTPPLSRSDRVGMYLTIAIGALGAAATLWFTIARLIEVAPNRNVPVLVPFVGETAKLPIGPDGALLSAQVEQATVIVPHPAAATYFALIAEPIVVGITILALIALLCAFCWKLARGQAFQRSTTVITIAAAFTVLGGWAIGSLFTTMTVNGALSAVSNYTYDGVLFSTDFTPVFAALALGAIGAAFQVAERLRRETDGLV
jgi:hypothetical protein